MIGLVLVSHGDVAAALKRAAEHVVGAQAQMISIAIEPQGEEAQDRARILAAIEEVNDPAGVILLTDMYGGTPSNLAFSCLKAGQVDVIAGVNLPLLIKLCQIREIASLADAVEAALDAGRGYIKAGSEILGL